MCHHYLWAGKMTVPIVLKRQGASSVLFWDTSIQFVNFPHIIQFDHTWRKRRVKKIFADLDDGIRVRLMGCLSILVVLVSPYFVFQRHSTLVCRHLGSPWRAGRIRNEVCFRLDHRAGFFFKSCQLDHCVFLNICREDFLGVRYLHTVEKRNNSNLFKNESTTNNEEKSNYCSSNRGQIMCPKTIFWLNE